MNPISGMNNTARDETSEDAGLKMLMYLEGDLAENDAAALSLELRESRGLRREFAKLLLLQAHLAEIGKELRSRNAPSSRVWRSASLAAAAGLAAGTAVWFAVHGRYPQPQVSGSYAIVGNTAPGRGVTLRTGSDRVKLALGGYCRIEIEPDSELRIEGEKHRESVFLKKGGVMCDVNRRKGAFDVRTGIGTVSATGTRFDVRLVETNSNEIDAEIESDETRGKTKMRVTKATLSLAVAVMAGSVSVEYNGKTYELGAGAQRVFAAEQEEPRSQGTTEGTVVQAGETLTLKTGDGETAIFHPKPRVKDGQSKGETLAGIALKKSLKKGMAVTVRWSAGDGGKQHIEKVEAAGTATGVVVEPREKGILLVKVEGVEGPMRFVSRWINPEGRWIPDPREVELIASVKTGAKVRVDYELQEHFRINKLTVVE